MSLRTPIPGQRWISDSEAELGLGLVLQAGGGRVEVFFPAANEHRQYALKSAPLRRVEFQEGERIKLQDGASVVIERVEERAGLLVYHAAGREVTEGQLSDTISFSKPEERLLVGQVDDLRTFDLRTEGLRHRSRMRQSPVRGFVGARIDLIPHQMFIAGEVAARLRPRVLLADEVGLGKTIEACLILHRLHLTGRADRVLILVPEALVHQWFVELLRRFNLLFSIFDEERCASIQQHDVETNPFLDSQLVLCGVEWLARDEARGEQARQAGWDLLVVDEAHHLAWTPEAVSREYALVESLAQRTTGVLLLTATPQQLGAEGHFARLRLLDPDRYSDLAGFQAEAGHYEQVATALDRLLAGKVLDAPDRELFASKSPRVRRRLEELSANDARSRALLVSDLLDEFGVGRVMFRNTRAVLSGFPERRASLVPLNVATDATAVKVKWLVTLLKELEGEKLLLICRTRELAEEILQRLLAELNVSAGVFHEGLTLLQRDRNAAYFADPDGARILICSEIGSEGRNFQFAHHLVLFDLPTNPELLEQRIGRLDRIGQTSTIHIHVPYVTGSESEVLARWFNEGLNAFQKNVHGATELFRALQSDLTALLDRFDEAKLDELIRRTRELHAQTAARLTRGHDRLLELNSSGSEAAAGMIQQIRGFDTDVHFEEFFVRLLDHFGVHVEELGGRDYLLLPGHLITDAFPALPAEGLSVTFDRARASSREDLGFMSTDHPLVRGALDLLLGSEAGNAAFAVWKNAESEGLRLEVHSVVECVAPAALHVDRFLPATPVRVVVDHALADCSADERFVEADFGKGDVFKLLDRGAVKKKLFPAMLAKAQELAAEKMKTLVEHAIATMERQMHTEIDRLETLSEINNHVQPSEIAALRAQRDELCHVIAASRLRLDAIRLVWQTA